MFDFNYDVVKRVNHYSSFVALESGIVHYKNRISLDDIITKKGKIGMVDYKNHFGLDEWWYHYQERGKWNHTLRFLEGQNQNHRLDFCLYKNGFNLLTVIYCIESCWLISFLTLLDGSWCHKVHFQSTLVWLFPYFEI